MPPYDGGLLPPSYFLDPLDPLFSQIGQAFIQIQTQIYGTNHYYNGDPFNEGNIIDLMAFVSPKFSILSRNTSQ